MEHHQTQCRPHQCCATSKSPGRAAGVAIILQKTTMQLYVTLLTDKFFHYFCYITMIYLFPCKKSPSSFSLSATVVQIHYFMEPEICNWARHLLFPWNHSQTELIQRESRLWLAVPAVSMFCVYQRCWQSLCDWLPEGIPDGCRL